MKSRFSRLFVFEILMLGITKYICNDRLMYDFNRHYSSQYDRQPEIIILPPDDWTQRVAELEPSEAGDIKQAIQEAATIEADVHLYRNPRSPFLGIALKAGEGPTVKIWEH